MIAGLVIFGLYKVPKNQSEKREALLFDQVIERVASRLGAADVTRLIAGMTYTLSGSGVSSSATSFTLASFTIPQNGYKIQDYDVSSTFYVTLEPGNRTRQEIISCTTVAQNAAGTATLSGCTRGLSPVQPYSASSTLQFSHAGGTQVIFSDPPQIFDELFALGNNATSTALLEFSSTTPPYYDMNPKFSNLASTTLISKGYADDLAIAGAPDMNETTKGIGEQATGLEAASSTLTGQTTAPLVLTTKYSTSSPYTTGYWIPVTNHMNKLAQTFFDLSEAFDFTAATTTVSRLLAHNQIQTGKLIATSTSVAIGGVSYTFPSSQGSAGTGLSNDGTGTLSWSTDKWTEVAAITTSAGSTSVNVNGIPSARFLRVLISTQGFASGDDLGMQFNSDKAGNYAFRVTENSTTSVATGGATTTIRVSGPSSINTEPYSFDMTIDNSTTTRKIVSWRGTGAAANIDTPPFQIEGSGVWGNTSAQISVIRIYGLGNGVSLNSGVVIRVYTSGQ